MLIGKRIRELRNAKNMTLTELSEKSGVQIATLSRMENLKMTGTLESHMNIARAMGVDITQLYEKIKIREEKLTVDDTPETETFTYNDKASYEMLTTKVLNKKMMPIMLRIEPGGKTTVEQNQPGSEKFIFILRGHVSAHIGYKTYSLAQNNTLYFDANEQHYFVNSGRDVARIISVITPVAL